MGTNRLGAAQNRRFARWAARDITGGSGRRAAHDLTGGSGRRGSERFR
jgi:hypothetical protein